MPAERPLRSLEILGRKVGAGLDELLVVKRDATSEPGGVGARAGHRKQVADLARFRSASFQVAPRNALEMAVAFEGNNLRARPESDGETLFDSADEIARHALGQAGPAHKQVYMFGYPREKDRRLSG